MGAKSTGNIGISEATIQRIMSRIIPLDTLKKHNFSPVLLEQITQSIAENLSSTTLDKDASYAIESAQFRKQFSERISEIGS